MRVQTQNEQQRADKVRNIDAAFGENTVNEQSVGIRFHRFRLLEQTTWKTVCTGERH